VIPYPTLHRFAVLELHFGRTAPTIPIVDGEPGHELQVDTGWVSWLTLPRIPPQRRRFRAWIFTAVRSRHRFVRESAPKGLLRQKIVQRLSGSFLPGCRTMRRGALSILASYSLRLIRTLRPHGLRVPRPPRRDGVESPVPRVDAGFDGSSL